MKKKKCVSIDWKCSKTHRNAKNKFYPFDPLRALRIYSAKPKRQSATLATPCHPQGPKDHAKFHADWTKTVGTRGIQTDRQCYFDYVEVSLFCVNFDTGKSFDQYSPRPREEPVFEGESGFSILYQDPESLILAMERVTVLFDR